MINQTNFNLIGLKYEGIEYYNQSLFNNVLSSLNPQITKPSDLSLLPVIKDLSVTDIYDSDDDGNFSLLAPTLSSAWVYNDGVNEHNLNASQLNSTFCNLIDSGITPYVKINTSLVLSTQYGDPKNQNYPDSSIGINSDAVRVFDTLTPVYSVDYAKPDITTAGMDFDVSSIWNATNGFVTQSTTPATYNRNFPTVGADGLYFDLILSCTGATNLDWDAVTVNGITATPSNITPTSLRITLSGPSATITQSNDSYPVPADPFINGTELVIKGKKSGVTVIEYGFVLNKWFIARHRNSAGVTFYPNQQQWCNSIGNSGMNYIIASYLDLSNTASPNGYPNNNVKRTIDGSLMAEWGQLINYNIAAFNTGAGGGGYITSDLFSPGDHLQVSDNDGSVWAWGDYLRDAVICVSH